MRRDSNPIRSELSILDRLTDLEPGLTAKSPSNSWEHIREFKASVCRDLAALLNTRRAEKDFEPEYEQATNSLLTFGVTDFTACDLNNGIEQEQVRCSIERAIRQFEPRLARVKVSLEEPDPLRPMLRFQVDALLRFGSAAEPV